MEVDFRVTDVFGLKYICFSESFRVTEGVAECEESGICFWTIEGVEEGDLEWVVIAHGYYFTRNASPVFLRW